MALNATKNQKEHKSKRFIELDMLRGLAIILMIFAHILWDLDYFGVVPINSIIFSSLQSFVPHMFFFIVGVCLIINVKKKNLRMEKERKYFKHLAFRGLKIICIGIGLSILSLIFIPKTPVFFGVLHCIGLSIILSIPFLKFRRHNVLFAFVLLFIGFLFSQVIIENPNMLHLILGLRPANIWNFTVDYFPIFPWFGFVVLGISVGDILYSRNERRFRFPNIEEYKPAKLFSWFGRHSLGLYLIHQPIITGFLYLFIRTF